MLNCSKNQLTILPEFIGDLVNLTRLDCSKNQLTILPESISNCVNLQELNCSNNKLRSLPPTLRNIGRFNGTGNLEPLIMPMDIQPQQPKIDPFQVHKYYQRFKKREKEYYEIMDSLIKNPPSNYDLQTTINLQRTFTSNINDGDPKKHLKKFDKVWGKVLLTSIKDDQDIIQLIGKTIQYVSQQSDEFKQMYNVFFIEDSYGAYDYPGNPDFNISCINGIIERVVLSLESIVGYFCAGGECKNLEFIKLYDFFTANLKLMDVFRTSLKKYSETEEGINEIKPRTKEEKKELFIKDMENTYYEHGSLRNNIKEEIKKYLDSEGVDYIFDSEKGVSFFGGNLKKSKIKRRTLHKKRTK
jgi:hypothetical protein